ncbi:hypothetical protein RHMOL_Rhmol01G0227300 [Rhododendron molle]|uniref:Uncharacterized protein n=1 Tax=Rhododendron molle TaxID=49168 RepID=A0ACC0Q403_RHOML|nr:hypothetical protein RHMOL_Rhmol01G0227300 [Rhododendron molle]
MYEPHYLVHNHNRSRRGRANAASCILATLFLLFLAAAAAAVSFVLFKPKDPKIAVTAVQFPKFSVSNGTFNLTFFQFVSVTNPNRDSFTHYDSSLQLVYSGSQVGVVAIPAGEIGGGRTQRMSAKFDVEEYPVAAEGGGGGVEAVREGGGGGGGGGGGVGTMEIETRMKLVGRVRVMKVFMHKVESRVRCSVGIRVSDGSVLGLHC